MSIRIVRVFLGRPNRILVQHQGKDDDEDIDRHQDRERERERKITDKKTNAKD